MSGIDPVLAARSGPGCSRSANGGNAHAWRNADPTAIRGAERIIDFDSKPEFAEQTCHWMQLPRLHEWPSFHAARKAVCVKRSS
jgi:hypothetical protein